MKPFCGSQNPRFARNWPAWGLVVLCCLLAASACSSQQIARDPNCGVKPQLNAGQSGTLNLGPWAKKLQFSFCFCFFVVMPPYG